MGKIKRSSISGFTISLFGYSLEVVTVHYLPVCVALARGARTICRFER